MKPPRWPRRIRDELAAIEPWDLALRLTLLGVVFRPIGDIWLRPLALAVAGAGLLFGTARRSPGYWLLLLGLATWRVLAAWPLLDNHAFLLLYWLLAACIALASSEPDAPLAWNGRVLIGLTFAFATLWKTVLSPDYLDGRFFLVTLVDDPRFEAFTRLAGGLTRGELLDLRDLVRAHVDGIRPPSPDDPLPTERLRLVADVLTWATALFEAGIAAVFLLPGAGRLARARHVALLVFCAGTYALAPVEGFGWLLLSMGIASCAQAETRIRLAYLLIFAFLAISTRWPWLSWIVD